MFVAWSRLSRRTVDLAGRLGLEVAFVPGGPPYLGAWLRTGRLLAERRPRLVAAQLPQGPLLARLLGLRGRLGFRLVADVHTGFLVYGSLAGRLLNAPFRGLLRKADLVVVHNEDMLRLLRGLNVDPERALVVYDPIPAPRRTRRPGLDVEPGRFLLLPASWAPDEPLALAAEAFASSGLAPAGYKLVVTGDHQRRPRLAGRLSGVPGVVLSGHLPRAEYEWLLAHSAAVLALTTREYTVLSALWEAVAHGRPAVVSSTRTLRGLLGEDYPCLAPPTVGGLREAMVRCARRAVGVGAWYSRLRRLSEGSLERLRGAVEALQRR